MSTPTAAPSFDERLILETALKVLSKRFDEFVGACMDDKGQPAVPSRKALMQARACLPPTCAHAFQPKPDPSTTGV